MKAQAGLRHIPASYSELHVEWVIVADSVVCSRRVEECTCALDQPSGTRLTDLHRMGHPSVVTG